MLEKAFAAVVVGADGPNAIRGCGYCAAGVGDLDDIQDFLADVGRNHKIATLRSQ